MTANLLDYDLDGLAVFCEQLGEKRYRAVQLFRWIHQKGASDFDAMSDLAKSLREKKDYFLDDCDEEAELDLYSEAHLEDDMSDDSGAVQGFMRGFITAYDG